ncbi:MAG TPA: hypothetical protein VK943_17560 [Arenibaculum sp.]|nr:hypothetical protein [Arenibaculum sp.]
MHRLMTSAVMTLAVAVFPVAGSALADCPPAQQVDRYVQDWKARTPTQALATEASLQDALCAQDMLVERLEPEFGAVVGYKAGLTSKATQERFGVDGPVRGQLLEGMLVESGTRVPADFGARPLYEADLLLVVGSEAINEATTPEEALAHISAVRPFIELPDLAVAEGEPMNGAVLTAGNVAARLGVMGPEMPIEPTEETARQLADMTAVVTDQSGAVLSEGQGSAALGSPLNAALWLIEDLRKAGKRLKAGDLISIGSLTPLTPTSAGQTVTVRYEGFPGTPEASVTFE